MSRGVLRRAALLAAVLGAAGCADPLPEEGSPGAIVLTSRCGGCHRVFAPGTMTFPMWEMQLDRMRNLFAQRGIPWLAGEEQRVLRDYLRRHAGTS